MNKKILIGSIIAVVILVLVSFSNVVAKVLSDDELVEFDVEFSGLGKKHTVELTQQEADEVEYVAIVDREFNALEEVEIGNTIILVAAWVGKPRLIDNLWI